MHTPMLCGKLAGNRLPPSNQKGGGLLELLCVFMALAALFLLCAFLTLKAGLHSALAPLTAIGIMVTWMTLCGVLDVLLPGMWVLCLGSAALGVWALLPLPNKKTGKLPDYRALFTPGAVLFWALCAAFAVYFAIRQPMAAKWDELNLWGTAVKVTRYNNRLYTTATLGWPWQATQNPGLSLLAYFFCFIGKYADWKIFLAYNALSFAVYAAVLGGVRWRQYKLAVPLAAILWCVPYFFTVYNHTIYLDTTYMSAYGDVPAGLVLGGAVAIWLALRRTGGPVWAVLPVLALAANIKSNTFVLSLVAAGLVAVDAWLFPRLKTEKQPFRQGLVRRTGFAALCFAAPLSVYMIWNHYTAGLIAKNAAEGGMGQTSQPLGAVVVNGFKMLLGQPVPDYYESRRAQFYQAWADMGHQFWSPDGRMSMIGQGCLVVGLIAVVFFGAWLVGGQRRLRLRVLTGAGLTIPCFLGYNLMLVLSYGFIFKPDQSAGLVDYNRYIYGFYIGWFLIALAFVSAALQSRPAAGPRPAYAPRLALAGQGAVLGIAVLMLLRVSQMVLPQLSVLGFSDSEFASRRVQRARAEAVNEVVPPGERVFYISQGDNGEAWFAACFDLYPVVADKSGYSGGTFGLAALAPAEGSAEAVHFHPTTSAEFSALVAESGCAYIYTDKVDAIFVESYAALFTDGLAGAQSGDTLLYKVTPGGYQPVETEVPAV